MQTCLRSVCVTGCGKAPGIQLTRCCLQDGSGTVTADEMKAVYKELGGTIRTIPQLLSHSLKSGCNNCSRRMSLSHVTQKRKEQIPYTDCPS
eukprot:183108-Rhodomonas_salina.2